MAKEPDQPASKKKKKKVKVDPHWKELVEALDDAASHIHRMMRLRRIPNYPANGRVLDLMYFAALDLYKRAEELTERTPIAEAIEKKRRSLKALHEELCEVFRSDENEE